MGASHLSIACCYAMRDAHPVPYLGMSGPTPISRRPNSWAVEVPSRRGHLSCGSTLEKAMHHALYGSGASEHGTFEALAGGAA